MVHSRRACTYIDIGIFTYTYTSIHTIIAVHALTVLIHTPCRAYMFSEASLLKELHDATFQDKCLLLEYVCSI